MATALSASAPIENHYADVDNATALSMLVALFVAKGDSRTATSIIESLQG